MKQKEGIVQHNNKSYIDENCYDVQNDLKVMQNHKLVQQKVQKIEGMLPKIVLHCLIIVLKKYSNPKK